MYFIFQIMYVPDELLRMKFGRFANSKYARYLPFSYDLSLVVPLNCYSLQYNFSLQMQLEAYLIAITTYTCETFPFIRNHKDTSLRL